MSSKLFLLSSLLNLFVVVSSAQTDRNLPHFATTDSLKRLNLSQQCERSLLSAYAVPERFNKTMQKDYKKRVESMRTHLTAQIAADALTDDVLWPGLQSIHERLKAGHPSLKSTKVLLLSNPIPNAFSVGDGTFVVYVGLLAGLENEDQVAFVLCHEMAHYLLEHSTKSLEDEVKLVNDPAFVAKIKALQREEFNTLAKIEAYIEKIVFKDRYHSREHELEADSLAFELYKNTGYDLQQALRMMEVFEKIDEPMGETPLELKSHFGCAQFPFQPQWEQATGSSSVWGAAHEARKSAISARRDSLRTHPEWAERLKAMQRIIKNYGKKSSATSVQPVSDYAQMRYLATLESIDAWRSVKRYDYALFLALQYQSVYPDCDYLKEVEALSLSEMYRHIKAHELSRVLAASTPDQVEPYRKMLALLNELRMKELLGLAECSVQQLPGENSEYGLLAAYTLARGKADETTARQIQKTYRQRFKNGRFKAVFSE
jgi:Peptidase family M48